jgi:hypothetical protein
MLREIDIYFDSKDEPVKGCLAALRQMLLRYNPSVSEAWRYRMPFYFFAGKRFCYLWVDKKLDQPYIGFVDGKNINHPHLLFENRSRMKILRIDPALDLPFETIKFILDEAVSMLSLLSQALVTGIMAWIFIHEAITSRMILGGLIILAGIAITFKKAEIPEKQLKENIN